MSKETTGQGFRFTLTIKFLISAILNFLIVAILGGYALNQMQLIGTEIEEVAEIDLPLVHLLIQTERNQLKQAIVFERILRLAEEIKQVPGLKIQLSSQLNQYDSLHTLVIVELQQAEQQLRDDVQNALIQADIKEFKLALELLQVIQAEYRDYYRNAKAILEIVAAGNWDFIGNEIKLNKVETEQKHAEKSLAALLDELDNFTSESLLKAEEHEKSALNNIAMLLALSLAIGVLISLIVNRLITTPVLAMTEVASRAASGDLSQRLKVLSQDEIGDLGRSLNTMLQTLQSSAEQADAIAGGNYSNKIEIKGDKDQLGIALSEMQQQIDLSTSQMQRSIALNKGILDTAIDAIITIDKKGLIQSLNRAAEKMFIYTAEELIGRNIKMLMPAPYTDEHDSYLKRYLTTKEKRIIGSGRELEGLKSDGSTFPIYLSIGEVMLKDDQLFTGFIHDMTQEKQLQADTLRSEALNRGIVNTSQDGIISITPLGEIQSVNKAALILFQYTLKELLGQNIKVLMPSPYHGEHDGYLSAYHETGVKKVIGIGREVVGLRKDGSTFPMYLSVGEVKQLDGTMFTGFVRDISKEKQFEADLQSVNDNLVTQNTFKSQVTEVLELTQGATDLALMCDQLISALCKVSHSGHGAIYIQNRGTTELLLQGSFAFKQRKNVVSSIAIGEGLVGQSGKEKKSILLTQVPTDYIQINSALGEQTPLNILCEPLLFEQKLIGVVELASFTAFTDADMQMIAEVAKNLGVIINNLQNQMRNKELLEASQQQSEELQVQQEELKTTNQNLFDQTQKLKVSEEELKQQTEELRVSNEELAEQQLSLRNEKDTVEKSRSELSIKAKELTLASKYKSEFLANMSHELRTPLNSLLLLAKGLADNKKKHLDAVEVEDAEVIYAGGNSLLALINDILDLSKVEAGKLSLHIESVNLESLCRNLVDIFKPVAHSRDLTFVIDIADDVPRVIRSDGQRLEQILRNLLSNAMKFTETGSVTLKISRPSTEVALTHSQLTLDKAISVAVIDTGIGIAEEKLQAIFEAFQQQDGSTSRKYGGTGLGLTIARQLTALLGGEIQLISQPSVGSTFSLYLPVDYTESKHEHTEQPSVATFGQAVASGRSETKVQSPSELELKQPYLEFIPDDRELITVSDKSLLVIDDDKHFARILRDFAREHGYKCLVAGDGRTGIYLAQEFQPQGIILDIMLPDIDGYQVLEQLKFNPSTRHIPVEIMSAHDQVKGQMLRLGAIGIETKPVSEEQLKKVLSKIGQISAQGIKHILLIEDDQATQQATIELLTSKDLQLTAVSTGERGCEEILSGNYDCVILDIGLPDMSGFEVLKFINERQGQEIPPIIIYTGRDITDAEQIELNNYSSTVVIKGVGSPERLLDDLSLFLHDIEVKNSQSSQQVNHILHDESSMLQNRKILLVDDDMRNTYALSKKLIEIGFDVDMANNGKQALELLEQDDNFELILMDTMMPIMDGYEATRRIRLIDKYKTIPIIALTAKTMPEDREQSLKSGASEYLTKPIDFDKLLSIMRIWLFKRA
ncbi:MAG: response regulator [Pseudomonadales bacterium]|nr:response regulator [Pseudomonadales bacterium]NRA18452.1 response regulator [Oceanospirillaceae bacterium]